MKRITLLVALCIPLSASAQIYSASLSVDPLGPGVDITLDALASQTMPASLSGTFTVEIEVDSGSGDIVNVMPMALDFDLGDLDFLVVEPGVATLDVSLQGLGLLCAAQIDGVTSTGLGTADIDISCTAILNRGTAAFDIMSGGSTVAGIVDLSTTPQSQPVNGTAALTMLDGGATKDVTIVIPIDFIATLLPDPVISFVELQGNVMISGSAVEAVPAVRLGPSLILIATITILGRFYVMRSTRNRVVG